MATINELVTSFGFDLEPETLNKIESVDKAIEKIGKTSEKLAFAFLGAKSAFDYITSRAMRQAQEMSNLSKVTGYSTESIQRWKYAAEAMGVSSDSIVSDLEMLRKSYLKNEEGLLQLADRFASMGETEAIQWASAIGISDDTLLLLKQGRGEIQRIMRDAYVIPEQVVKRAEMSNRQFQSTMANIQNIKDEIAMGLSPVLADLTTRFSKWLSQNKEWVQLKITNIIQGITLGFERFGKVVDTCWSFLVKVLETLGLITEKTPEVETIANIVTGALLVMTGAKVLSGMSSLILLTKEFGVALKGALLPITAIITGIEMIQKGIKNLTREDGEYEKNIFEEAASYVVDPIMEAMGIKRGALTEWAKEKDAERRGQFLQQANMATMNLPYSQMKSPFLRQGQINQPQVNDSHNTINMYVTTPMQVQTALGQHFGNLNPTTPGSFSPFMTP